MKETSEGNGTWLSWNDSSAHSPPTQVSFMTPLTPTLDIATRPSTNIVSERWWAPGASTGLPMVTMPLTRSGRRAAMPRASMPPRLCPTICTRCSRRATIASSRDSIISAVSRVQPMLATGMPAR